MIKKVCLSVLLMSLLAAPVVVAQSDSTLKQQITAADCNYTTIATGMGVTHDSTCPLFAPTIESAASRRGRPSLRGIYDAVHASVFRVRVAGAWYTLGKNHELTADGNVWTLDLSTLEQPLSDGTYAIMVEMRATDGSLLQTGGSVTVDNSEPVGESGSEVVNEETPLPVDSEDEPTPGEEITTDLLPIVIFALLGVGVLFWLLARKRTRRSRDNG